MSDLTLPTPGHLITIREDGIVCYKVLPGKTITLEMAQETDRILYEHIPKNKKRLMLFDIREGLHIDGAARGYSAEQGGKNIKALAILLKGAFANNIYEIFFRFQNPSYPMKSFTNKAAAIEWLKKENKQKVSSFFNFSWRKGFFACCSIFAIVLTLFLIFQ